MKRIRYLTIRFDAEIQAYEVPAFRGAVVEKAGREHVAFHNHLGETGFVYRYPVIQYKRVGRNPLIVCVDEGVDEIHHFFQNQTWDILLGDRPLTLRVRDLRLNQYTLQAWEHSFALRIENWLALNTENYARYQALTSEEGRLALLEQVLTGNILSLAKGLGWFVERPVVVRITRLSAPRWRRFKEQLLTVFDADFESNVFLPEYIGLGKGVSHGFGVVFRSRANHLPQNQREHGE
ncbi:MAG: hypothetical protein LH606_15885 [Cytophagaceae bacterium]|nr:hypothetical protein [Cytophagaceae bacterium]